MIRSLVLAVSLAAAALAGALSSPVAHAAPPTEVRAIGTLNGVTYTLYQGYGEPAPVQCPYEQFYTASNGTTGCWRPDQQYPRYDLFQLRPTTALVKFLYYSQAVTCPPGTTNPSACLAQ